jgi:hypothetical protein
MRLRLSRALSPKEKGRILRASDPDPQHLNADKSITNPLNDQPFGMLDNFPFPE